MLVLLLLLQVVYFNSIKVRLKRSSNANPARPLSYFNSIKVRLKPPCHLRPAGASMHFNSIKVRLKLDGESVFICHCKFQFHKGTIKTVCVRDVEHS